MRFLLGILQHWIGNTVHKVWVAWYMNRLAAKLIWRSIVHDLSKYGWTETKHFARTAHKLKRTTYGTKEYYYLLEEIKPAIQHHYKRNRHHPEHWSSGIEDMSALDEIEMICDWAAACKKHKDGNPAHSAAINAKRFGYGFEKHIFYRKLLVDIAHANEAKLDDSKI